MMAACLEPLVRAQGVATCVMGNDLYNRRQAGDGVRIDGDVFFFGFGGGCFFSLQGS